MKKNIEYLDQKLIEYGQSQVYPFHMPGHKRQDMAKIAATASADLGEAVASAAIATPESVDITEVDGFDNLHHAEGIIAEGQARMAEVFGADRSFFLVNGSTCGLLSAICAAVPRGGKILIARNCHKAVYHGIFLQGLSVEYVYPMQTAWEIQGSIDPADVKAKLEQCPDIQAVLLTSPTYDGVVSDIAAISQIVHEYNIPLIVDEAHGAHFGFSDGFPKKALALGADVVIESIHKTLPAFTQTAALHVMGDRVNIKKLQKYLGIFQSSSPSYIFMAGLDRCSRILKEQGPQLMMEYEDRLKDFYHKAKALKYLKVFPLDVDSKGIYEKEMSKILIFTENSDCGISKQNCTAAYGKTYYNESIFLNGNILAKLLLEEYGLQMEMESAHYVTALTSMMDTQEGFDRLISALLEIDNRLVSFSDLEDRASQSFSMVNALKSNVVDADSLEHEMCNKETTAEKALNNSKPGLMDQLYRPKEKQMEIQPASECDTEEIDLATAAGRVSCEFAYLYPPGIPFLVPGEVIPADTVEIAHQLMAEGFEIQGLEDLSGQRIKVATC